MGTIDGAPAESAVDLYLERRRLLRTWTPAHEVFSVEVPLQPPRRIGAVLAWLTTSQIEISDDLVASYPVSAGLAPRVTSSTSASGDEITHPVGGEPILSLLMSFYSPEVEGPLSPNQKIFQLVRALSPQRPFFLFGRDLSESWIIGRSARRNTRYVMRQFGKHEIQPVNMEVA